METSTGPHLLNVHAAAERHGQSDQAHRDVEDAAAAAHYATAPEPPDVPPGLTARTALTTVPYGD